MNRLRQILKDRRGVAFPLIIAIVLVLVMLMCCISEYFRLLIVAQGVRDAVQEAVISTVNDNYDDVYHGVREGYSGAYQPLAGDFEESLDYGDIYGRLDDILGLTYRGGYHTQYTEDGGMEFRVWGLDVEIRNAPFASGDSAGDRFVALDSPFNHCEQGKIVIPRMRVEPSIDNEEQHIAEMAAFFRKQVESKKHLGMLVLFASGRAMQRFLDYVTDLRLMLLVQGDQPRYRLVELHRKRVANGERSVLVGLQSFAEGLDLKGDLLSQVHIHKIAFPPIDSPVVITEGEWLKSLNRYPFEVQSLPSASFNLIQQVGRLIRSHGCWGEVVIYDKRLLTKNYGKRLLDALPVFPIEQPEVPEGIVKKKEKTKSPRRRRR